MRSKKVLFIIVVIVLVLLILFLIANFALRYYHNYSSGDSVDRQVCEDAETGETVYYSGAAGWDAYFESIYNEKGEKIDWSEWPTGKELDIELINCKKIKKDEFVEVRWDTPGTLYLRCSANNGRWLEEYKECENFSEDLCDWAEGEYFPCESACRHDPQAEVCTLQCVEVCKFDPEIFE